MKHKKFAKWLKKPEKGMLITGPTGVGKTTFVKDCLKSIGYIYTSAADKRNQKEVHDILHRSYFNVKCIVFDEIDGLSGDADRGAVSEIVRYLKNKTKTHKYAIICICNSIVENKKLSPLKPVCEKIAVKPLDNRKIVKLLSQKSSIDKKRMMMIAVNSNGDLRYAFNLLRLEELKSHGLYDKKDDPKMVISKAAKYALKPGLTMNERCKAVSVNPGMVSFWMEENAIKTVSNKRKIKSIAQALDCMCDADLFETQIRESGQWDLYPHQIYAIASMGYHAQGTSSSFFMFPQYLGKTSKMNRQKKELTGLCKELNITKYAYRLDYAETICKTSLEPLHKKQKHGIADCIKRLESCRITNDNLFNTLEPMLLCDTPKIPGTVKSALTRAWKKKNKT